ncbi:MAG TPA: ImmA/IrrE family metallo-endopeptidase, partial [Pseudomonas sp.]|uniref:ImmA/IrrE family metallo-endopeptidase n=1 Tax=Pseudomonas sp. TaxID=306 RepID=UPI002B465881
VADVMGGLGPQFAEKRANAFAAELLLPQASAEEAVRNSSAEIESIALRLERKFVVSRAMVCHQILNSNVATVLDSSQVTALEAWARLRPGFPVVQA